MGKKHKKGKKPEEKAIGFGVIQIPYRHSKEFMRNINADLIYHLRNIENETESNVQGFPGSVA